MVCVSVICKLAMKWYLMRMCPSCLCPFKQRLNSDSFINLKAIVVVYHLHRRTGWLTVVVNGTRQIRNGNFHGDALVPFPRLFSRKIDQR